MVSPPRFEQYPELRAHFNAVFDLVAAGMGSPQQRRSRGFRAILDVGTGNGAALAAIVFGTELHGVAADVRITPEWLGPPGFAVVASDAHALPFRRNAFTTSMSMDTIVMAFGETPNRINSRVKTLEIFRFTYRSTIPSIPPFTVCNERNNICSARTRPFGPRTSR